MTRSKSLFRLAAVVLIAFSMVMSSCFVIRKFTVKPKFLTAADPNGQVFIDLYPSSTNSNTTSYLFVLVGTDNTLDRSGTGPWDAKAKFGGQFGTVQDNALETHLLAGGNCASNGVDASTVTGLTWDVWRSTVQIDSSAGALNDNLRVKVLLDRNGNAVNGLAGGFMIFHGRWTDNGNGLIDAGEVVCTSFIASNYPFEA